MRRKTILKCGRILVIAYLAIILLVLLIAMITQAESISKTNETRHIPRGRNVVIVRKNLIREIECPVPEPTPTPEPEPKTISSDISDEEIELLALVTMAEAEGEPEKGKRLVIDTILNRKDSPHFPNTVYEVVYQKNQFTCMWNGRIDQCYVREDILQLVNEELESRMNSDVIFFRTKRYSSYGVPMFQVGHHYFSSYV